MAAPALAVAGPEPRPARLVSLDVFRGLTVAGMILVNNPGTWSALYWPLEHAKWHGWTPTDLIFPFFLFMVGMALNFSRRLTAGEALRRGAALIGLGLFMAAYPFYNLDLATLRWPGVLQRIGLCYLAAWGVRRLFGVAGQALTALALLAGYWLLMTRVSLPGGGAPSLEPDLSLAAHIDRIFLTGHMWSQTRTWDPEGFLSTLPAIATTLLGCLAGAWLRTTRTPLQKTVGLLAAGVVLTLAGMAWGVSFPINKSLWTSSYVLLTAGLAAYLFGLCYWLVDVRGYRKGLRFFVVYGVNAIFVFVASGLLAETLYVIKVPGLDGVPVPLQVLLYQALFASWLSPPNASLAYALGNVLFWYFVLSHLDRRGLYFKV